MKLVAGLAFLLNTILFATYYSVAREALGRIDPIVFSFFEMTSLVPVALGLILCSWKNINGAVVMRGIFLGSWLCLALITIAIALKYTTATSTAFFPSLNGFLAALIAWIFLRQPVRNLTWFAGVVSIAGTVLLVLHSSASNWRGSLIAFLGGVFFTCYVFLADHEQEDGIAPWPLLGIELLTMALWSNLVVLLLGDWRAVQPSLPHDIWVVLYVAGACTLLPTLITVLMQKHISPVTISFIYILEPILGAVVANIYLHELLPIQSYAGGMLVVAGAIIHTWGASFDALANSLSKGQLALSRQRTLARKTVPLKAPTLANEPDVSTRRTGPLATNAPSAQQGNPKGGRTRESNKTGASPAPTIHAYPTPHKFEARSRRRRFPVALFIVSLLILVGAGVMSYISFFRIFPFAPSAPVIRLVGHFTFLNSEQLSENSSQGIDDEVQIDLHGLSSPAVGKSYYAWLLGDNNQGDTKAILLGKLPVNQGNAYLLYPGDQQHTNLLEFNSRFVVTEEDAALTPITPSPDYSAWRYYGEIPHTPDPLNSHHYSFLDHTRHLLASEPMLSELELPGGLNNWFYRNTGKLIEWTGSTRDRWEESKDLAFARRQTIRALTYLDGLSFVQQDLPPDTALPDISKLGSVGLLDVNGPNQNPASYIGSIVYHLNGLLDAPGSTPDVRKSVSQIMPAMNNVQIWLEKLRADARQIVAMTDTQLGQPEAFALLNDMVDQANHAYGGQIDPTTGATQEGVTWIYEHLQSLATFPVTQYNAVGSPPEIVPNNNNKTAFFNHI